MQESQPFRLIDVRLTVNGREGLPSLAQPLGDLSVVHVGVTGHDLASLQLRPDHKGVHWSLDVVHRVFLGLWGEEMDDEVRGLREVMGSGEREDGEVRLKLLDLEGER